MTVQPMDGRRARGEATRRAMVEAAVASVSSAGLSATTVTAVAQRAGVSPGLVNFHFKSKEQLLAAALEYALAIYELGLREALAAAEGPRGRLTAYVDHDTAFPVE